MSRSSIKKQFLLIIILFGIASMFAGCGGGGGGGAPVNTTPGIPDSSISISKPASGQNISDTVFQSSAFVVELAYNDSVPINMSTLAVTLKMDGGAAVSIRDYFTQVAGTNKITSSNLNNYTNTLFTTNTTPLRTMTINVSVKNINGGAASAQVSFSVYPASQPPPITASSVTITNPTNGETLPDNYFCFASFTIEMKYTDAVAEIDMNGLSVLMSMNNGTPVDITSKFSLVDSKTLKATDFTQIIATNFFQFQTNVGQPPRTMTLSATVKNVNGGIGSHTISFSVSESGEAPPGGLP